MKKFSFCLLLVLNFTMTVFAGTDERVTVSGYIKDAGTGEELIGVPVYVKELKTGSTSNVYGFYSVSLPPGTYHFQFSYLGYAQKDTLLHLDKSMTLNLDLHQAQVELKEVVIAAEKENQHVTGIKMSSEKLNMETVKTIPAFMGEVDVLKSIQLLPGVQSGGEGTTGFNVRGGSPDQNLIQLDEAPVYNASHLLGFFSVFNADAIKDVEIYKGGIPAEYGGRLSSLVDIRMKEGNNKRFSAEGGLGTISSRLTIEAPIVKDRSSFFISGRRTYADLYLRLANDKALRDNRVYFYDLNAKLNYKLSDKDKLFVSGYFGQDVFKFGKDFKITWGNKTATTRWNHVISHKLFSNVTLLYSDYDYTVTSFSASDSYKGKLEIKDFSMKADLTWYLNTSNTFRFGINSIYHTINPGSVEKTSDESVVNDISTNKKHAFENALYLSNDMEVTSRLSVQFGIRYSFMQNIGGTVFRYDGQMDNVVDTVHYNSTRIHHVQGGFEPRMSARFTLNENSSVKVSYNRTLQYLHLVSNTAGGTPLDIYIPSDEYIKPQVADQVAAGYFRNFRNNMFEASVEAYYKNLQNQIDFKDNADLLLNNNIEREILSGSGKAYGVELMIKKQKGKLSGWLSYTWSHSERTINSINNGNPYPVRQDRPHSVNIVTTYQLGRRWEIGGTWVFASGNAITMPSGGFLYNDIVVPVYTERNGYRMPASHRLDLSVTLKGKEKPGRKWHSSWNLSLYNVYARQNPYSIQLRQNADNPKVTEAVQTSIVGTIIPSITYNFKF